MRGRERAGVRESRVDDSARLRDGGNKGKSDFRANLVSISLTT